MGIEREEELDDRWLLGLRGRSVSAVDAKDHQVVISVSESSALAIESEAVLTPPDGPTGGPAVAVTSDGWLQTSPRLVELVGHRVLSSVAFKTGDLRLVFDAGMQLRVAATDRYEAWNFRGISGRSWVSLPGGGLATFEPVERS